MRTDPQRRGRGGRIGIAVLAIVLVCATSASAVWHEEHAGDQDCAVCQLRPESAAASSFGSYQCEPTDASEPMVRAPLAHIVAPGHESDLPARAPPACMS